MSFSVLKTRSDTSPDTPGCADYLSGLGRVLSAAPGLQCSPVAPHGDQILCVFTREPTLRHVDIGVTFEDDHEWWFTWAKDSRTIGTVSDVEDVAGVVIAWLRRPVTAEDPQE